MHHTIEIRVPTETTEGVLAELEALEGVVALSVLPGASIKHPRRRTHHSGLGSRCRPGGRGSSRREVVMALDALRRVGLDVLLVVVLGGAVVLLKQRLLHHNRRPLN